MTIYSIFDFLCTLFQRVADRVFGLRILEFHLGTVVCCIIFASLMFQLLFGRTFIEEYFDDRGD